MRKIISKLLSILLMVGILFNMISPFVAYALSNAVEEKKTDIVPMESIEAKGDIEVETHLVLPIRNREENNIIFTIYDKDNHKAVVDLNNVNKPSDGYYEESIKLGNQDNIRVVATERDKNGYLLSGVSKTTNVVYISVNLYSLDKGKYTIELSGKHFVTYKVDVTLDDFSKRVRITDEAGMFEIGDITNDGKVNEDDTNLMFKSMENNDLENDLNLDGKVDIADLNYITAMITNPKGTAKIEDTNAIISGENVSFEVPEGIVAENSADLSALFTEEGVVSLQQNDENPIELGIDLSGKDNNESILMDSIRIAVGQSEPESMKILVEDINGEVKEYTPEGKETQGIHLFTEELAEGVKEIKLGKQTAVKKVTIVVTANKTNRLADIAKVEFLNNVKVETKMPDNFYTPKNVKIDTSVSEQITVSFEAVPNVTGYEIRITGPQKDGVIYQTTYTTFTIEDLKNYATYKIELQSVNQEWRSGWTKEPIIAIPQATRRPPAVDMVVATPTYSGITFKWQDMEDTKSYNIYYREEGTEEWLKVNETLTKGPYTLKGLKDGVTYEAYLTGNNDLGEGDKSTIVKAKTLKADVTIVPKYKLINTESNEEKNNHIKDVIYSTGTMTDDNKFSIVDDKFNTYYSVNDWQINAHYSNMGAPIIVLDKSYKMNEFVLTVPDSYTSSIKKSNENDLKVYYFENDSYKEADRKVVYANLSTKKDENNRVYYVIRTYEPITATAIQFGLTAPKAPIEFNEVKIYEYDSLVDDVAKLFVDDLRVELADGVNQAKIDELRKRADVMDNNEYNPYRDVILSDLKYAEDILNDRALNDVITLNPKISNTYNGHLGFAMTINDYQPLGVVVKPGDTINVYVGNKSKANIELVYTQYHAEANAWNKSYRLVNGQNTITIEQIGSSTLERGGSIYVRYTSTPDENNPIKVRVSGGTKIPMVDTTLLTTEKEKKDALRTYIEELEKFNSSLNSLYVSQGKAFDSKTGVLGSTEIVTRHGLWSVSSVAVLNALNDVSSTLDEKVERLYESTEAFDEMMEMFYRHKGLEEGASNPKDEIPAARINIRYMTMFDGAFMYAGGYHVGIEYGSIAGLVQAHRNSDDATGYFGWGISHEIGHQINQGNTVFAEVTNNVYALLAQTSNDKDLSRLEGSGIYSKIYEKVTSHTQGRAQNVFVQLGMYWQLHLAYDDNKTFDDVNSIYSRINKESRTFDNSTKKYSKDDLLILFASKAANKDLTDFFATWGLIASEEVSKEIKELNLEKETKAIYYLNDSARRYRLSNNTAMDTSTEVTASIQTADNKNKRVTLSFDVTKDSDKILGYEILRNGVSIGFVQGDKHEFIDNIGAENNRAYKYSIVAYDYLLNKTDTKVLDEIKISHDGSVIKNTFTIESNVKDAQEIIDYEDEDMDYSLLEVNKLIDGKNDTYFNGTVKYKKLAQDGSGLVTDSESPYVIINLNDRLSISGIKYKAALVNGTLLSNVITKYNIYVSSDKVEWTLARTGTFELNEGNDYTDLVYFMGQGTDSESQLWTYSNVSYIKIEAVGNKNGISGAEIDVIAPPGDNVDFENDEEGNPMIAILSEDYCPIEDGCKDDEIVKAGSVIIQGSYRGNPSFNVVLIADAEDDQKVYDGEQYLYAELNSDNSVYEIADGTWLYVMTEEQYTEMLKNSSSIRAYLYRVDDATNLDGQRLTSTSTSITNLKEYNSLPKATIK